MKTVVVIGSNSFSGAHYVDHLIKRGDCNVIGISRSPEKSGLYLAYKKRQLEELKKFKFFRYDLNKDMPEILSLIDSFKAEYIVNFASQSIVGYSWKHPVHWYQTNVVSTVALCEGVKGKDWLKKYVHISTPEVYGHCSGRVKEDNLFNPSTPYAGSRAAADDFIKMLIKEFDFPAVFTRAANVFGPNQQLFKIIPRAIIYMKLGKKIPLHGGGEARRSFIHIQDVCEGTYNIMVDANPGSVYHLSTDRLISIADLARLIAQKLGVSYEDSVEIVGRRRGLDDAYILDSSKVHDELGWVASTELENAIDETITWVETNWEKIKAESLEYEHKE